MKVADVHDRAVTTTALPHSCRLDSYVLPVKIIVEVGGWEHECCGTPLRVGEFEGFGVQAER